MKLNLGCGKDILEGFLNLDKAIAEGIIFCDLDKGLPFPNNSADYILASHVFEHLSHAAFIFQECLRVLKVGGILRVILPHYSYWNAYEPYHLRAFGLCGLVYGLCRSDPRLINLGFPKKSLDSPMRDISVGRACFLLEEYKINVITNKFLPHTYICKFIEKISPFLYEQHLAFFAPAYSFEVTLKKIDNK